MLLRKLVYRAFFWFLRYNDFMKIELKEWSLKYLLDLVYLCNNVDRTYLTGNIPYPYRKEDALWFIRFAKKRDMVFGVYRAIVVDGKCIGEISVVIQDDIYIRSATLGYYLLDDYKNNGIATKVVKEICALAFEHLIINRITATTFEDNFASRRVLEKNGFVLEGILKDNLFKKNKTFNECIYGKCLRNI